MQSDLLELYPRKELLSRSSELYQLSLCSHTLSASMTKRSILFLYLFGWRYISRRQIYNLLSYELTSTQSVKNAEEFIGKFVRDGLIKKCNTESDNSDNHVFTPTKKGVDLGYQYFVEEVRRIYESKSVFFYRYADELLLNEIGNLEKYATLFSECMTERYKNKLRSSVHRLSTMDSYIAFLRHFLPTCMMWYGVEIKFYGGTICDDELFSANTEVRSDAAFCLSLKPSGLFSAATDANSQLVCIEQDTSHQTSFVLKDKIERYINLIALPRIEQYGIPPLLAFTVIPSNVPKKRRGRTGVLPVEQSYVDELLRFGFLYCKNQGKRMEQISIYDFYQNFREYTDYSELFDKHLDFLEKNMDRYGKVLPLSMLPERLRELSVLEDDMADYTKKIRLSYCRRRSTIFGAAASIPQIEKIARMGFSICATSNYEPSALLSLFPEFTKGRELITSILGNGFSAETVITYTPFYRHRCRNGVEIVFRNAYTVNGTVYVIENIAEDFCGNIRMKELLINEPALTVHFLAVFPVADYVTYAKEVYSVASARQRDLIYGCAYQADNSGGIAFITPTRISILPSSR